MVQCPLCEGAKVLTHLDSETWTYCPMCRGLGGALDGAFDIRKEPVWNQGIGILHMDGSVTFEDDGREQ